MYSKKEKNDLIVKSLNEGCTYREITKIAHCSPNEVARVRKTIFSEGMDTSIEIKVKSACSQVFCLLEKGIPLAQIIPRIDIDPDEAMKIEDKYLQVSRRDRIVYLLNDQEDMVLTIEVLEFLKANPDKLKNAKEMIDYQTLVWNLQIDRNEIEEDIEVNKILLTYYDKRIKEKEMELYR